MTALRQEGAARHTTQPQQVWGAERVRAHYVCLELARLGSISFCLGVSGGKKKGEGRSEVCEMGRYRE